MTNKGKFGTVINCMDGRVQIPVIEWMKREYSLDYVDSITIPGPDMVLALSEKKSVLIRERVDISINAHGSGVVAVTGHHDCAGNPVNEEKHKKYIKQAVDRLKSWELEAEVIGLWIREDWTVERVI